MQIIKTYIIKTEKGFAKLHSCCSSDYCQSYYIEFENTLTEISIEEIIRNNYII